jgi:hypothetical protein
MKTRYEVVVYQDSAAAPAVKVVKTLAQAAARLESAGDRVWALEPGVRRHLTKEEQSELDDAFRKVA